MSPRVTSSRSRPRRSRRSRREAPAPVPASAALTRWRDAARRHRAASALSRRRRSERTSSGRRRSSSAGSAAVMPRRAADARRAGSRAAESARPIAAPPRRRWGTRVSAKRAPRRHRSDGSARRMRRPKFVRPVTNRSRPEVFSRPEKRVRRTRRDEPYTRSWVARPTEVRRARAGPLGRTPTCREDGTEHGRHAAAAPGAARASCCGTEARRASPRFPITERDASRARPGAEGKERERDPQPLPPLERS